MIVGDRLISDEVGQAPTPQVGGLRRHRYSEQEEDEDEQRPTIKMRRSK
jgi:hypothetical protein